MKYEKVLIVDDMEINRGILCEMFKDEWKILEAEDGQEAMEKVKENYESIAVILLDVVMPKMNGFEVLTALSEKKEWARIPVILITGDTASDVERQGYEMGVSDIIMKPFNPHVVKRRVKNTIDLYLHQYELEDLVEEQTQILQKQAEELRSMNTKLIDTLGTVVEFRNLESGEHIKRIKGFTRVIMECLAREYPEYHITQEMIEDVTIASAMHDVGKIAIPDNILLKPGKLTDEEFEIMKTHTTKGCEIIVEAIGSVQDKKYFDYSYEICRHHHERYDGKGYPDHLKGEEIPIAAQAVSIADVYDALVSKRCYKDAFGKEQAYQMILNGECGTFSPKILKCFKLSKTKFAELADKGMQQ